MQRENKVDISDPYEDGELKEIKTNTITGKNKWQERFDKIYPLQVWSEQNPTFINDLHDLVSQMLMFEIKYGTKILYEIQKPNKQ